MKENEEFVGINISEEDVLWIKNISRHIPNINNLINFDKYNKVFNRSIIDDAFHFTYEKREYFEKDKNIIQDFYNNYFLINNINPILLEENYFDTSKIYSNFEESFSQVNHEITSFISRYINSKIGEFFVQLNNNDFNLQIDHTRNLNNFINTIEDPKSKNILIDLENENDLFINEINSLQTSDRKKIISYWIIIGVTSLTLIFIFLLLLFFR